MCSYKLLHHERRTHSKQLKIYLYFLFSSSSCFTNFHQFFPFLLPCNLSFYRLHHDAFLLISLPLLCRLSTSSFLHYSPILSYFPTSTSSPPRLHLLRLLPHPAPSNPPSHTAHLPIISSRLADTQFQALSSPQSPFPSVTSPPKHVTPP